MRRLLAARAAAHRPLPRGSPQPARVTLDVIGYVANDVRAPRPYGWERVESSIELIPPADAGMLAGLEGYSHIIVCFVLDRLGEGRPHPSTLRPGGEETPLQGVLATRSQLRPTPIGISVVPLLGVDEGRPRVLGLDAIDGTPVLDLKPYIPHYDSVPSAGVPGWVLDDGR